MGLDGVRRGWAKKLIVASQLFFAKPGMFNDPLDSRIPPSFEGEAEGIKRFWRERRQRRSQSFDGQEEQLEQFVRTTETEEGRGLLTKTYFDLLDTYGIACFVPRANNFLMWSYYAASHSGISVRFDMRDEVLQQIPPP
jgi:hypothetical protein